MTVQCLTVSGHDSRQCGPHAHYPSAVHLSHALCARTHVINVINARRQPLTSAGHQPGASGARRAVCRARVCRQAREHTSRWTQVTNEGAAESPGTNQRTALHSGGITSVRCSLFSLERAQLSLSQPNNKLEPQQYLLPNANCWCQLNLCVIQNPNKFSRLKQRVAFQQVSTDLSHCQTDFCHKHKYSAMLKYCIFYLPSSQHAWLSLHFKCSMSFNASFVKGCFPLHSKSTMPT